MTSRWVLRSITLALLGLGTGIFSLRHQSARDDSALSIRIAHSPAPAYALIYLAEDLGEFRTQRIDVQLITYPSGRDSLKAVFDGSSDLAVTHETPVVVETYNGRGIGVITSLHRSSLDNGLIALRDRGIHRPQDLAGKRIGVIRKTTSEFYADQLLLSTRIARSAVSLRDVPPDGELAALTSGRIDAIATWEPVLSRIMRSLGPSRASVFRTDLYASASVLAGARDRIPLLADRIRRVVAALAAAAAYVQENPEEAASLVRRRFPDMDAQQFARVWENSEFDLGLDNQALTMMRQEARWLRRISAFSGELPDLSRIFMPAFLERLLPEAVTVLEAP